jgi:hypothetical protein
MPAATPHVHPVGDEVGHVIDGDECPCGPAIERVECADGSDGWVTVHGSDGWVTVHHSLDGREMAE